MYLPLYSWIELLVRQHATIDGGLAETLDWDTNRARDYQCMAQLIYCCDKFVQQAHPQSPAKIEEWISQPDEPNARFKADIKTTLDNFCFLAADEKHNAAFKKIKKRVAPVEFVFIGKLFRNPWLKGADHIQGYCCML
jgi:hypothetical protein